MQNYEEKLNKALRLFDSAEGILVFSGAGMAYNAGLHTYGNLLHDKFGYFADKYLLADINDGFSLVAHEDREKFFRLYAQVFHFNPPKSPVHKALLSLIRRKPYFIAQTNPDGIYDNLGVPADKIMHIAGFPHLLQCASACNDDLIPMPKDGAFPVCPVCGGAMRPYLDIYGDDNFVRAREYLVQIREYGAFVSRYKKKRLLIFELECGRHDHFGFNAHVITRTLARDCGAFVIRINKYEPIGDFVENFICFDESADKVIADLLARRPPAKRGRPSKLKKLFPDKFK